MKSLSNQEQFIGRGEKEVKKILWNFFPKAIISIQVPIQRVIDKEDYEFLDQEFKNHKCDIVVNNGNFVIVVEVNYKHREKAAQKWSEIFKPLINKRGYLTLTIEDYNCEVLFSDSKRLKEKKPWGVHIDIIRELERNRIGPDGTLLKM